MFRPAHPLWSFAVLCTLVVCLPAPLQAQTQPDSTRTRLGVRSYLLPGVYDNLSVPRVPSRGLPAGIGLRDRGVYLPGALPGFRQEVRLLDGSRIRFQTLYGTREVQRPTVLTLQDYLDRTRRVQGRRLLMAGFLQARTETTEQRRSGNLLDFEIPITVPRGLESVVGVGGAGLTISGSRMIRFAGRSEWTEGAVSTATAYQTRFPALNMEQQSQFRITGTIGDKIEVSVDQDSRALTDLENNINIRYRGYEDEVIQEIVAGNTDFSLPGSQFVGFSQSAKGLFGIKGRAQLGPLSITALAAQEKGSSEKATFRAGAKQNTIRRPDIEPLLGTYYFLDAEYRNRFSDRVADLGDSITAISVFIDDQKYDNDVQDSAKQDAQAYFDPSSPQPEGSRETHTGSFHELDPEEYYINRSLGVLALNVSLGPRDVLGVVYRTFGGEQFGALPTATDSTLVMKLIKPLDPRPEDPTWDYELRNVYYLGSRNIPPEGFKMKVFFNPPSGDDEYTLDGRDYLNILGLDQWGELPGTPPDGNIDLNINYVNLLRGELIFPDLEPFLNSALVDTVEMYDTIDRSVLTQESKYYLEITTATRATTYSLPATGILDGSESVTLNGRRLERGTDYQVNYLTGELTFLTDAIQDPTAEVAVDYEYSPLIQLDQKVLMGVRSEYELGTIGRLAGMVVSRSERTLDQRVRLGREPNQNLIWDAGAQLDFSPAWLTRAVDALPMVTTEAPSRIQVEAEIAHSIPDPNTTGEALMDDFEGAKDATGFGIGRGRWFMAAPPVGIDREARSRFVWFNPYERIPSQDIWPDRETNIRSSQVNVLSLAMIPERPNPYPAGAWQWDSIPLDQRWNGVQQAVGSGAADLSRLSFIEVWLNGNKGRLHIDLGAISEDLDADSDLDTEDRLINGVRNAVVDAGEDVGIDGRTGAGEFDYFLLRAGLTLSEVQALNDDEKRDLFAVLYAHPTWYADLSRRIEDPSLDDFRYTPGGGFSGINGTERNSGDPDRLGRPDTEDINGNGYLDRPNSYFSYVLDLSPDSPDSVLVAGGSRDRSTWDDTYRSWRLYRIPLSASVAEVGSPDLSLVESVRIWVDGVPDTSQVTISIAALDVVGNQWRESPVLDSGGLELPPETLQISVRNTFDNPEYSPPPGVRLIRDPVSSLTTAEQSLALTFNQLPPGVEAQAFNARSRPEDLTQYKGLAMYINGRPAGPWVATADTSHIEAFVRFGADENNFYEVRRRVYPDWDTRNEIEVPFDELTSLKEELLQAWGGRAGVPDTTLGDFRVRGRPSLTNVRRLFVGLYNRHPSLAIDGELWVDELRVIDVRRDPGTASRFSLRTQLADFSTVDFRMTRQTADFHGLREKRGRLSTTTNSTLSVRTALDRLTPSQWGLVMPMTFNLRSTLSLPKYQPGSDRILESGERYGSRTEQSDESLSLSVRKQSRSTNPLMAWTVDRMAVSWTGSRRDGVSPVNPVNRAYQSRGSFDWDLNPNTSASWHPFRPLPLPTALKETAFNPVPTELRYGLDLTQIGEQVADRSGQVRRRYVFTAAEAFNVSIHPFSPVRSRYSLVLSRDMTGGRRPSSLDLGREVGRQQTFATTWNPRTFRWLGQQYSYSANYRENNDPRYKTQIITVGDSTRIVDLGRDVTSDVGASAGYTLQLGQIVGSPVADDSGLDTVQRFLNDMKKLMNRFSPVNLTLTNDRTANLFGLQDRPISAFRLGLISDPGVSASVTGTSRQSTQRDARRVSLGTTMMLPLQVQLTFRPERRWTELKSQSKTTFTSSSTWPFIDLRWSGLQQLWIFPDLTRSISIATNYQHTRDYTDWLNDASGGRREPFSSSDGVWRAPFYSVQAAFPNGMGVTFGRNLQTNRVRRYSLGRSETRTYNSTLNLQLSYSFSAPDGITLPIIGRIRMQSQMQLQLNISRTENETKVRTPRSISPSTGLVVSWNPFTPTLSQATWSFRPQAQYNFSRRVRGGFDMTFQNVHDRLMRRTRKVREVAIFVNLLFS